MKISYLRLQNFRNFIDEEIILDNEVIGLLGENAQGKTNILEAVYLLASGNSWRTSEEIDLINENQQFTRVDGKVVEEKEITELSVVIQKEMEKNSLKKSYMIDQIKRKKELFLKVLPAIVFSPEDILLINGTPSLRRKALDAAIVQAFSHYGHILSQYGKIITSRNRVLDRIRERTANLEQLHYWTAVMIKLGCEIYQYRYAFMNFCNENETDYQIKYLPNMIFDEMDPKNPNLAIMENTYRRKIETNLEKEIISAASQYGPHKDDYSLYYKNRNLSAFGSRGEQRGGVLHFKKMQLLFCQKSRKTKPLLLLDDIFSEFDRSHRIEINKIIKGYQTIISGTESQFFEKEGFGFDMILEVENGKIRQ